MTVKHANGKSSLGYRMVRALGFRISKREYGDVTIGYVISRAIRVYRNGILLKLAMDSSLLGQANYRMIRPALWRVMGAQVAKRVYIGSHVWIDIGNAHLITVEEGVHIANGCFILCHERDFSNYAIGDKYEDLGYRRKGVHLEEGCFLGSRVMVLPGVKVGTGSIVASGSVVRKSIPSWTLAMGIPARVVKKFEEK